MVSDRREENRDKTHNISDTFMQKVASRLDIFNRPPFFPHLLYMASFFLLAAAVGSFFGTRDHVEIATDFFENIPAENADSRIVALTANNVSQEIKKSMETTSSGIKKSSGGDPRARVTKKSFPGKASGKVKGHVGSVDMFARGGAATSIDAILSGTGGLKSGGASGAGRKGIAGIGYGAGYGSGLGRAMHTSKRRPYNRGPRCVSHENFHSDFSREGYEHVPENRFKNALSSPLSTFSIDVDVASYANIRRFVSSGQLPPPSAVRIEEMINYFSYVYPSPSGNHSFSLSTELSHCPWNKENLLARIGIQGKHIDKKHLPPFNLVFLIDVSGSMMGPDKLPLLKSSFRLLVNQLREDDRVSMVVYAGAAGTVLEPTSGSARQKILDALDQLEAGGSTAGSEGILKAYALAKKHYIAKGNNRVILATDGDFNVGVSSDGELVKLIEKKRRDGIFLSVLGFGTGNYQDAKMEKLANKGNGNYAYIDRLEEAKKVLVRQMGGTLMTIAKDMKVQVEFNPARVQSYRLIGYENRMLAKEDFNDDAKDAGELGAGHSVTALYELVPAASSNTGQAVDALAYQTQKLTTRATETNEYMTLKLRYKKPDGEKSRLITMTVDQRSLSDRYPSADQQFVSAVAGLGMILKGSTYKGVLNYDMVIRLAQEGGENDHFGYRKEFLGMVEKIKKMGE